MSTPEPASMLYKYVMRDRAGRTYDVVGGLLAGILGGALLSASTGVLSPTSPVTLWIVLTAMFVLALYMMIAGIFDWPLPFRKVRIEAAVNTGNAVAKEIHEWLSARQDSAPAYDFRRPTDEQERHEKWQRESEQRSRHSERTNNEWREKFAVRALAAYDHLYKLLHDDDHLGLEDRWTVEHPTNTLGMEAAATTIGVMSARVAERHGVK